MRIERAGWKKPGECDGGDPDGIGGRSRGNDVAVGLQGQRVNAVVESRKIECRFPTGAKRGIDRSVGIESRDGKVESQSRGIGASADIDRAIATDDHGVGGVVGQRAGRIGKTEQYLTSPVTKARIQNSAGREFGEGKLGASAGSVGRGDEDVAIGSKG